MKVESSLDSEMGNPSDRTRNRFPGPDYDLWGKVCVYARVLNESKLGQRRSGDTCTGKSGIRPPAEPREEATIRTTVPPIKNLVHSTNAPPANQPYPTAHLRMLLVYLAGQPIQIARYHPAAPEGTGWLGPAGHGGQMQDTTSQPYLENG